MRVRRSWLGAALLGAAAAVLILLTWFGTISATKVEQREAVGRVEGDIANQALLFEGQFQRELQVLEQTLRILERAWEESPNDFDLSEWRDRALVLPELSLHIFIADSNGIIRASTRPELIGVDVSTRDYFRYEMGLPHDDGRMFIAPSTRGHVTNRWQMNMARRLDSKTGEFKGVIAVSYDTSALTRFYRQADLGDSGMIAIVGLNDGRLRALVGPGGAEPGLDISGTPMMAALRANPTGRWLGPSAPDGVERIHAFRVVPDRDLAVVLAFDERSALRSSLAFIDAARIFALGTTVLIVAMAGLLLRGMWIARRREGALRRDRAILAAANAELELARQQADAKTAQLEAILAGMSDGVSMLDADLRLVAWNHHFAEFDGVPPELLRMGTPVEDLLRAQACAGEFGEAEVDEEVARRVGVLRSGEAVGTFERPRPGGRTLELRRTALPDGGYVTLYNDITVRKQIEEAMRRARELAEATTEAKSRLVATVSHEIRTPLNTLLNSLRLLSDTGVTPSQRHLVEMACQAGDGLLGLINDILEMSKMEAGRLTLRPALFALRPMLDGVLRLFGDQAIAKGLSLSLVVDPEIPDHIRADAGRIRQVLVNLLSNAVKFSAPGPIFLLADPEWQDDRQVLRLTVRDPGPALSNADRARIFKPFSQLDRFSPEPVPGTGLGLAISQGLATLMRGEIGCGTSAGGGNDFWLTIPIELTGGEAAEAFLPSPARPLPRTRILLVEDVLPNQVVTAALLRREGHMVDVAASGEVALRLISTGCYDVVLMDVFMPGLSGIETAARIRAMPPPNGTVAVIALTANVSEEDRARCFAAGMDGLVPKPVDISALLQMVSHLIWSVRPVPSPAPPANDRSAAGIDALCPDRIAELRANLTPKTLMELAKDCLAELRRRLNELERSLVAGSLDAIAREGHAMGGLAASYGLAALDARLRDMTAAARAGDLAKTRSYARELESELDHAEPALLEALSDELIDS